MPEFAEQEFTACIAYVLCRRGERHYTLFACVHVIILDRQHVSAMHVHYHTCVRTRRDTLQAGRIFITYTLYTSSKLITTELHAHGMLHVCTLQYASHNSHTGTSLIKPLLEQPHCHALHPCGHRVVGMRARVNISHHSHEIFI